jgi:hypothetical protein
MPSAPTVLRSHRGFFCGLFVGGFLVGRTSGPALGRLITAVLIYRDLPDVPPVIAAAALRDQSRPHTEGRPRATRAFAEIGRALRDGAYRAGAFRAVVPHRLLGRSSRETLTQRATSQAALSAQTAKPAPTPPTSPRCQRCEQGVNTSARATWSPTRSEN